MCYQGNSIRVFLNNFLITTCDQNLAQVFFRNILATLHQKVYSKSQRLISKNGLKCRIIFVSDMPPLSVYNEEFGSFEEAFGICIPQVILDHPSDYLAYFFILLEVPELLKNFVFHEIRLE